MGPRYKHTVGWCGKYRTDGVVSYYALIYTWEVDLTVASGKKGVLNLVPDTWISEDFRYAVFPPDTFYYLLENPKDEDFADYLVPKESTWGEYDIARFARRNGCEYDNLVFIIQI